MSAPRSLGGVCSHWYIGQPAYCQMCLHALQAPYQYGVYGREENSNLQRYLQDERVKDQQRRDLRRLQDLDGRMDLMQNGTAAILDFWGRQQPPSSYPYPPRITELDASTPPGRPRVTDQVDPRRDHEPREGTTRRPSDVRRYINPGPPEVGMGSIERTSHVGPNHSHRRQPLRSITGTSAHNSRNSRSVLDEDMGESSFDRAGYETDERIRRRRRH
ncbi:hypothetical protein AC578_7425 [Pseudocercospora eumusae]|uniref:Uncharacterized protein n=1 Tax=Pseudocercospora eumusae TaxID=321146 RepID=A0A139GY64_9PEZI|nr:hypothetical protein AC578_7425 [Pseudocercospora eumusae]